MFTGLVETTGTVEGFTPINGGARLTLIIPFGHELSLGDSVAVNGCCLTVDALEGERISFDLLSQTLRVTSLGTLKPGMLVNLERAMSAMDRFGGHFVMGHVDNTGTITALEPVGQDHRLEVRIPDELARYCIDKGSITIDGISLTIANLNGKVGLVLQAGAMQYIVGNVQATTGLKGVGDFLGKMVKSSVTKESAIKPEYVGTGVLVTEPTYKYLLTENVGDWTGGLVMEDGMFLACESTVKHEIQARSSLSSAALGNEGLFNLRLAGNGVCVLESNVPRSEIVEIDLQDDVLKVDGSFAICWSGSLSFTVERSGKTLLGSAASGEGLVNVYKGTGKVWLAPLTPSQSLVSATHAKNAK